MVWCLFITKLEMAETIEGVALNVRTPYFYPTSTRSNQTGVAASSFINLAE